MRGLWFTFSQDIWLWQSLGTHSHLELGLARRPFSMRLLKVTEVSVVNYERPGARVGELPGNDKW